MSMNALLSELSKLSPSDLKKVQACTSTLLGKEKDGDSDGTQVYEQIRSELRSIGLVSAPHFAGFKALPAYASFKKGRVELESYIRMYFPGITRVERGKVLQILVESILRYLKAAGAPITLKTVVQNLNKVGEAVESQYPGYADCGMLLRLVHCTKG